MAKGLPKSKNDAAEKREREVLQRMLNTPPKPHKPKPKQTDGGKN